MPLVVITLNTTVEASAKAKVAEGVTAMFNTRLKTSTAHVHVHIADGEFISFGGDHQAPAAYVTIKSASGAIDKHQRTSLVGELAPLLVANVHGLPLDRVYLLFEELPVENVAIGSAIMQFMGIRTVNSSKNIELPAP